MSNFEMVHEMEEEGYVKDLKHFKLRAECLHDVLLLLNKIGKKTYGFKIVRDFFPDVEFEFLSTMTSDEILAILSRQVDSHVMMDTFKPFDEYTGER